VGDGAGAAAGGAGVRGPLAYLGKRIKDHAALLKELPPEAAKDLQALLVDEVRSLTERDRRRLDRRVDWLLNLRRVLVTVAVLAALFALILLTPEAPARSDGPGEVQLGRGAQVPATIGGVSVGGTLLLMVVAYSGGVSGS
jgi:hypothetical protein